MKTNKKHERQGRTQQQYEDSAKLAWYGVVGMIILLILSTLIIGCTTTKECCEKAHTISLDK
jgi:hypothetical protein